MVVVPEGVTEIEDSVALVPVSVTEADFPPYVAEMTLVPAASTEARPLLPVVLEMVATLVFDDVQVASAVRSCVAPSLYVPVAVSWTLKPFATDRPGAVTWMELSV